MDPAANSSQAGVLRAACPIRASGTCRGRKARSATPHASFSPWLLRAFSGYSRWYLSRHFHSLRISRAGTIPAPGGLPLVIYVNHASWWDPLVCLTLQNVLFANRQAHAPMDARALQRYRFFSKLGFFPVDLTHPRGAGQFIRKADEVLRDPNSILWLTPQGRFADVRERPVRFQPGLGHLPRRIERAAFVSLAIEYTHWEERKMEILCRFGPVEIAGRTSPLPATGNRNSTRYFERQLQNNQDALALEVQRRSPEDFELILRANSGVGIVYDAWRAVRSAFTGQRFQQEHGNL